MADAMLLKLAMGSSAGLEFKAEEAGQILVTTDTKKMYVDISDSQRIQMNAQQADKVANALTLNIAGDAHNFDGSEAETIGIVAGSNVQITKNGTNYTFTATDTTYESLKNPHGLTFGAKTYDGSEPMTLNASDLGLSNAMHFAGTTTSAIAQDSTMNPISINDKDYQPNAGDVVLYAQKEFVWDGAEWVELGDQSSYALKTISITGDNTYITGGGTLADSHVLSHALINNPTVGTVGNASNHHVVSGVTTDAAGHVTGWTSRNMADEWADLTIQTSASEATEASYSMTYDPAEAKIFTIYTMGGAKSDKTGYAGLVPAPAAGEITRVLTANGAWSTFVGKDGITVDGLNISNAGVRAITAIAENNGEIIAENNGKIRVNTAGVSEDVTVYVLPAATAAALGGVKLDNNSNITNDNGTISITAANVRNALGLATASNDGYLGTSDFQNFTAAYDAVQWGTF